MNERIQMISYLYNSVEIEKKPSVLEDHSYEIVKLPIQSCRSGYDGEWMVSVSGCSRKIKIMFRLKFALFGIELQCTQLTSIL